MYRPAEWDHHDEIIMAWPEIQNDAYAVEGGGRDLAAATRDISAIAEAVAEFEPVTLLVTPNRLREVKKRFKHQVGRIQSGHNYPSSISR